MSTLINDSKSDKPGKVAFGVLPGLNTLWVDLFTFAMILVFIRSWRNRVPASGRDLLWRALNGPYILCPERHGDPWCEFVAGPGKPGEDRGWRRASAEEREQMRADANRCVCD